jgi:hypothetical protein
MGLKNTRTSARHGDKHASILSSLLINLSTIIAFVRFSRDAVIGEPTLLNFSNELIYDEIGG